MADLLEGKRALVTGGASGIGLAIVNKLLHEGAHVFSFDKNLPPFDIRHNIGNYTVCLTNQHALQGCMHHLLITHGLDILVNCAGIDQVLDLTNFKWLDWEPVLATNLAAPAFITAKAATHMKENGIKGSIIFITSVHTALAFPGGAVYDASKHGLVGLMRNVALEFGPYGIRANAVAPGFIYPTGITGGLFLTEVEGFSERIPSRRFGKPEDVANVVAFLATEQASYINGAEIRVDGGLAIQNHLF